MIPDRAFDLPLTHYEFRLLAVLCRLTGQEGTVEARIAELGTLTRGASEKTVRRALKALEDHGLISRRRLRSAGGYLDRYEYSIISLPVTDDRLDNGLPVTGVQSLAVTHDRTELSIDQETASTISNLYQGNTRYTRRDTTYPLAQQVRRRKTVVIKKFDDGDDIGGFGLIEDPAAPLPKIAKNDPKTRRKRPQHEWTPTDVAAEFSMLVGSKFPWLPGTMNTRALAGALAKYRTQYRTTPLIELELLRLFVEDERNFTNIGNEEPHLYKKYLASFRTKMNQARENLGLDQLTAEPQAVAAPSPMLRASDGREFPNSMSGRVQLKKHEERLAK